MLYKAVYLFYVAVLRIHDILVWIRGSMPVTSGSGFGSWSCYFRHWPLRLQKFSAHYRYFLKIYLHNFSKIKSQGKKSQNSRNQGLTYFSCLMKEGSGSVPLSNWFGYGSRRPKSYGSGSAPLSCCILDWERDPPYVEQCRLTLVTIVLLKMPQPMEVDMPLCTT